MSECRTGPHGWWLQSSDFFAALQTLKHGTLYLEAYRSLQNDNTTNVIWLQRQEVSKKSWQLDNLPITETLFLVRLRLGKGWVGQPDFYSIPLSRAWSLESSCASVLEEGSRVFLEVFKAPLTLSLHFNGAIPFPPASLLEHYVPLDCRSNISV